MNQNSWSFILEFPAEDVTHNLILTELCRVLGRGEVPLPLVAQSAN